MVRAFHDLMFTIVIEKTTGALLRYRIVLDAKVPAQIRQHALAAAGKPSHRGHLPTRSQW
jgi:hypothetical protein